MVRLPADAVRDQPCVLVVEDDPDDRNIYGIVLCRNGFNVLFAEDYDAGLQLARAVRPDAMLLDLGLPGRHTGLELCLAVRRFHATARLPIVVLTGFPEARLGDAARLAGCTSYIEKPASPLDVLREVRRLIGDASAA